MNALSIPQQYRLSLHQRQVGGSLVEFSLVAFTVVLIGLFTLQLGLLYHAKTTLNYATFEAARAGAVNNGSMAAMRSELGIRLAPLQGGDGSERAALAAIAKSSLYINDPLNTKIAILNPTKEAFTDWQIRDPLSGEFFIPANHLRHQAHAIGTHSGLSLRDANLLKLKVTHGVDLQVPVAGRLMSGVMKWFDPVNTAFYLRSKWPVQSVATVRMQSNALKTEILKSASAVSAAPTSGSGGPVSGNGSGSLIASDGVAESTQDDPLSVGEIASDPAMTTQLPPACVDGQKIAGFPRDSDGITSVAANKSGLEDADVMDVESAVVISTTVFRQSMQTGELLAF